MKKQWGGFVFFMTLCIILVISLLLMTCMQHILLFSKAINRQEYQHQIFYQLEENVIQLAQRQMTDSECIRYTDNANKVLGELFNNEGCSLKKGTVLYRYIIEDLGEFPCILVHQNNKLHSTHHTRVTMIRVADLEHPVSSILQVRYVKAITALLCSSEGNSISAGVSSWRYFSDYQ